jgi:hypothetical protein
MIAPEGPYLLASILCERVLEEKDGSLTAVRLLDRLLIPEPPNDSATIVSLMLLVVLRKGEGSAEHRITFAIRTPSGIRNAFPDSQTVSLGKESDEGLNLRVGLSLGIQEEGIHWIDVQMDGATVNRIPLRVTFVPAVTLESELSKSESETRADSHRDVG